MKAISLDLGCGKKKRPGYLGIDIAASANLDLRADLFRGIPLRDSVAERVYCDNFLEHVPNLIAMMNEIWRVCRHGAIVEMIVPYYTWMGAYQDPTHVRFFCEKTLIYFTRTLPYDYGFRGKFDVREVALAPNPEFQKEMSAIPFDIARKYFMNAVTNMSATLVADKNFSGAPRTPHEARS